MNLIKYLTIFLVTLPIASFADTSGCNISGTWKHADKNAWLELDLSSKTIKVKEHEDNPKANGYTVIKDIKLITELNYSGYMYHAANDNYVAVELVHNNCKEIVVLYNKDKILTLHKE
ncbi:hypothetical protein L3Q70_18355 (plasmid) [Pseudoalteromonas sp. CF6-2]|uniref:hypothetical protein n=1 Tax=Pseudoalteromonas sp. CF6-2 TaxID=562716 RepID=UPI001F433E11|nr:hypothetical protein L3Q70_18355 [Pseudoalteromonas sp. CF6-2]|tara:strand:+ start:2121 stop:2474 length:354 start_codon:yes stop_codon:yes gene_type:complete